MTCTIIKFYKIKNYYSKLMLFSPRIRTSTELFINKKKKKIECIFTFLETTNFLLYTFYEKIIIEKPFSLEGKYIKIWIFKRYINRKTIFNMFRFSSTTTTTKNGFCNSN